MPQVSRIVGALLGLISGSATGMKELGLRTPFSLPLISGADPGGAPPDHQK